VIAVVNTNPDLVALLKAGIEAAGFIVLVIHITQIREGLDVEPIIAQHDPQVIMYDVVMPYDRNWRFLQHLRDTSFKDRRFVLTTPNAESVERLIGKDDKVYAPGRRRRPALRSAAHTT